MSAASLKSATATAPTGNLRLAFVDTNDEGPDGISRCIPAAFEEAGMLHPVKMGDGWTDGASWSPCTKSTLPDNSVLESATKSYGPLSVASAVRYFPGSGGAVEMTWWNYATPLPQAGAGGVPTPDSKRALSPSPITVEKLVAALSDTSLVPPLAPLPVAPPPSTMLQASDFGPGWTDDPAGSHATTGDLVVDNGCVNQQNPVATPQTIYGYTGKTPSGISVTASAGVDVMKSGSGPSWMSDLRQHGTGGCDTAGLPYTRDTMSALPAGTGDDAFIENWYGQGNETFFIRFGDDIMRVDVTTPDQKMPAFTQADKDWFAGVAAKAAARHSGKS
jgi:hypothetical protein